MRPGLPTPAVEATREPGWGPAPNPARPFTLQGGAGPRPAGPPTPGSALWEHPELRGPRVTSVCCALSTPRLQSAPRSPEGQGSGFTMKHNSPSSGGIYTTSYPSETGGCLDAQRCWRCWSGLAQGRSHHNVKVTSQPWSFRRSALELCLDWPKGGGVRATVCSAHTAFLTPSRTHPSVDQRTGQVGR